MNKVIEKYRLLVTMLHHQDKQIMSTLTWNVVVQGALVAILKLPNLAEQDIIKWLPVAGIILTICWILSGERLKNYTDYYIKRLKRYEQEQTDLKDFMIFTDGEAEIKKGLSKVLYLFFIPLVVILMWLLILIANPPW